MSTDQGTGRVVEAAITTIVDAIQRQRSDPKDIHIALHAAGTTMLALAAHMMIGPDRQDYLDKIRAHVETGACVFDRAGDEEAVH